MCLETKKTSQYSVVNDNIVSTPAFQILCAHFLSLRVRCHRGIACTAAAARNTPTRSSQSLPQFAASAGLPCGHPAPPPTELTTVLFSSLRLRARAWPPGSPHPPTSTALLPHAGRRMPSCVAVWLRRPTLTCMCRVAGELGLLLAWRSFVGMAHGRWMTPELPDIFFL